MEHGTKRATAKGPSDWFTGDVYIDAVAEGHGSSPAMVAFVHPPAPAPPGTATPSVRASMSPRVRAASRRVGNASSPCAQVTLSSLRVASGTGMEPHQITS